MSVFLFWIDFFSALTAHAFYLSTIVVAALLGCLFLQLCVCHDNDDATGIALGLSSAFFIFSSMIFGIIGASTSKVGGEYVSATTGTESFFAFVFPVGIYLITWMIIRVAIPALDEKEVFEGIKNRWNQLKAIRKEKQSHAKIKKTVNERIADIKAMAGSHAALSERLGWLVTEYLPTYLEREESLRGDVKRLQGLYDRNKDLKPVPIYLKEIHRDLEKVKSDHEKVLAQIQGLPTFLDHILAGVIASNADHGKIDSLATSMDKLSEALAQEREAIASANREAESLAS